MPPATGSGQSAELPVLEVRFPAMYAWGVMGFGCVFFVLGLLFALPNPHRNLGLGVLLSATSVAAVIGANYWRGHLHVVARLTPGQLVLRRDGAVNWDDIVDITVKTIRASYHGAPTRSEFVCIRLKSPPPPKDRFDAFFRKARRAVSGYDIILGASELSCTADWFVAECRKRMDAKGASTTAPESHHGLAA